MRVERAAVLGAGTMGAQIAAHLANAGVPTLLWKLLAEIAPGDRVVLQRVVADELGAPRPEQLEAAVSAGAVLSEPPGREVQDPGQRRRDVPGELIGSPSTPGFVPPFVWSAPPAVKRAFLQALFDGNGSSSLLPRHGIAAGKALVRLVGDAGIEPA